MDSSDPRIAQLIELRDRSDVLKARVEELSAQLNDALWQQREAVTDYLKLRAEVFPGGM